MQKTATDHICCGSRTRKQIRTATLFQAPPPQGGASTNSATRVSSCKYIFIPQFLSTNYSILTPQLSNHHKPVSCSAAVPAQPQHVSPNYG